MPLLDWTRTQFDTPVPGGGTALQLSAHHMAAFEIHILGALKNSFHHSPYSWKNSFPVRSKKIAAHCWPVSWQGCPVPIRVTRSTGCKRLWANTRVSVGQICALISPASFRKSFLQQTNWVCACVCILTIPHCDILGLPGVVSNEEDIA